jgi:hypothetical protein
MSELENEILTASEQTMRTPSLESLQQQVQSLRGLLIGALMALFLLSVALNLFLYRQDNLVRKELAAVRTASRNLVADYETNKQPLIQMFVSKLQEYARAHSDFNPVLQKYNILPQGPPTQSGQPPSFAPAPAPSASKSP